MIWSKWWNSSQKKWRRKNWDISKNTFTSAKIRLKRILVTRALQIYKLQHPYRTRKNTTVDQWQYTDGFLSNSTPRDVWRMFVVFRDHRQKTFVCSYNRWSIIRSLKRVICTCNNELPGDLITVHNRGKYFYIVKECPRFKATKRYVFPGGIVFRKNSSIVLAFAHFVRRH